MNKKIIFTVLCILVVGIAYYGISPLFNNVTLDEPTPTDISLEVNKDTVKQVSSSASSTKTLSPEVTKPVASSTSSNTPIPKVMKKETGVFAIKSTPGHPASGGLKIITLDNSQIIRYENFKTINGPDLFVYLSKDIDAKEYINLGRLKATEGNMNYEIPDGININDYSYVLVWCKAFGVLFNSADISKSVE